MVGEWEKKCIFDKNTNEPKNQEEQKWIKFNFHLIHFTRCNTYVLEVTQSKKIYTHIFGINNLIIFSSMICKYVYVYAYIIKQTITQTCKHLLI